MGKAWDSFSPEKPILRSGWDSAGTDAKVSTEAEYAKSEGKSRIAFGRRRSTYRCTKCGKRDGFRNEHACGDHWVQEWVDKAPLEAIAFENWSYQWAVEAYRVMKPGAHLVAFGGTRMFHRLACALEDAGFEIRDSMGHLHLLGWVYGAGFPKSLDVSKALDSSAGVEREPDQYTGANYKNKVYGNGMGGGVTTGKGRPVTEDALRYEGFGTALKPAWEPIILARKPLVGTVSENIRRFGTGALNIDAARIGDEVETWPESRRNGAGDGRTCARGSGDAATSGTGEMPPGRWPANVLLSHSEACQIISTDPELIECAPDCPVRMLNEQSGEAGNGSGERRVARPGMQPFRPDRGWNSHSMTREGQSAPEDYGDRGGASRFFYCAKADRSERDAGVERNQHPTVKPLELMRWLVRLITPPGGVVLDPFCGSGTTAVACKTLAVECVGIEREAEYAELARSRVENTAYTAARGLVSKGAPGQGDLFARAKAERCSDDCMLCSGEACNWCGAGRSSSGVGECEHDTADRHAPYGGWPQSASETTQDATGPVPSSG